MLIYFLIVVVGIICLVFVAGMILPAERKGVQQCNFNASPEKVFKVITNNADYAYRSDVREIVIQQDEDGKEVWDEISKSGAVIRFKTIRKEPYSLYEFEMTGNGFTGVWTGKLSETGTGGTLYTSTETIRIRNPFMRILSYLFFNIDKFMQTYQNDLRVKLNESYV